MYRQVLDLVNKLIDVTSFCLQRLTHPISALYDLAWSRHSSRYRYIQILHILFRSMKQTRSQISSKGKKCGLCCLAPETLKTGPVWCISSKISFFLNGKRHPKRCCFEMFLSEPMVMSRYRRNSIRRQDLRFCSREFVAKKRRPIPSWLLASKHSNGWVNHKSQQKWTFTLDSYYSSSRLL